LKYILKKDLPFAKAGSEVVVEFGYSIELDYSVVIRKSFDFTRSTEKIIIKKENYNEWIGEAKSPREFNLWLDNEGNPTAGQKEEGCFTWIEGRELTREKIKVREVLE